MSNSCHEPLKQLVRCVRLSPCVQQQGRSVRDCCSDPATVGGGGAVEDSTGLDDSVSGPPSLPSPASSPSASSPPSAPSASTSASPLSFLSSLSAMGDSVSGDAPVTAAAAGAEGACATPARLYLYCKREQLDMRSRIRGNKALR